MRTKPVYRANLNISKATQMSYKKALGNIRNYKRSKITIHESKRSLELRIIARDLAALRASINSITKDIQTIESTVKSLNSIHKA